MHLLSPFSLNLPLYEHKKRPSYVLKIVNQHFLLQFTCTFSFNFLEDLDLYWDIDLHSEYICILIIPLKNKFSFLKEGLPSLKQYVHLVCWEHHQLWLFLHCTKTTS